MITFQLLDPADPVNNAGLFQARVLELLTTLEATHLQPYVDVVGIATIGIGYNIRIETNLRRVIEAMGVRPDQTVTDPQTGQQVRIIDLLLAVTTRTFPDDASGRAQLRTDLNSVVALYPDPGNTLRDTFEFQNGEAEAVFPQFFTAYNQELCNRLVNNTVADPPSSFERIALLSVFFNGGPDLIGPGLRGALRAQDRAQAWIGTACPRDSERLNSPPGCW